MPGGFDENSGKLKHANIIKNHHKTHILPKIGIHGNRHIISFLHAIIHLDTNPLKQLVTDHFAISPEYSLF